VSIKLNKVELDLLRGQRHEVFALYVRLRERMDYATGYVGLREGCYVSWQGLREDLYVEPKRGVATSYHSKEAVRRMAVVLSDLGLLSNCSRGKQLIFKCVLADADNSARMSTDRQSTRQAGSYSDTFKASKDDSFPNGVESSVHAESGGIGGTDIDRQSTYQADSQADRPKTPKADTHPVSGKDINSTHARKANSSLFSPIDDSFQIPEGLEIFVRTNLFPNPPDLVLCRLDFIEYHSGYVDPQTKKLFVTTEENKEKLFRRWLIRAKGFQDRDAKKQTGVSHGKNSQGRRLSPSEQIRAANSHGGELSEGVIDVEFVEEVNF